MKYSKCLSYPLPFYATQIFSLFLDSRISANNDKVEGIQLIVKSLLRGLFHYCKISFDKSNKTIIELIEPVFVFVLLLSRDESS